MNCKTYLKIHKHINIVTWFILHLKNNISYKYTLYLSKIILTLEKLNNINFDFNIICTIILITMFCLYKIFCY